VIFSWNDACKNAFQHLVKQRLTVLACPSFARSFVLEADASLEELRAILPQLGHLHPIAYSSRAIDPKK